jgi:hypothetical protein
MESRNASTAAAAEMALALQYDILLDQFTVESWIWLSIGTSLVLIRLWVF